MVTENLSTLKIHKLTQAQYDRELEAGNIDANALYLTPDEITAIENGGTGATNGETAMKNLLASGDMILSSYQYGTSLPTAGTAGRIFFKKVSD